MGNKTNIAVLATVVILSVWVAVATIKFFAVGSRFTAEQGQRMALQIKINREEIAVLKESLFHLAFMYCVNGKDDFHKCFDKFKGKKE